MSERPFGYRTLGEHAALGGRVAPVLQNRVPGKYQPKPTFLPLESIIAECAAKPTFLPLMRRPCRSVEKESAEKEMRDLLERTRLMLRSE